MNAQNSTDLQDAGTPESVARILRNAAQRYAEAPAELSAAWGDPSAGAVWAQLARVLETAANQCDRITAGGY